jgi:DNA-binding NarL/FixJ family response regulator
MRQPTRASTDSHSRSNGAAKVRVAVADGQALDRAGLAAVLAADASFRVEAEFATVEEVIHGCRENPPDVLLLTLTLPGANGRAALPRILEAVPGLPIVALSARGHETCVVLSPPEPAGIPVEKHGSGCSNGTNCLVLAAAMGAKGTFRRDGTVERLLEVVHSVANGVPRHETEPPTAGDRHTNGAVSRPLSGRETQVAALIARGRSNKEISATLGISEATVKKHVGHMLTKLKLQDRLQIGLFVARNPLILGSGDVLRSVDIA